jgi:hypothetical protein
VSKSAFLVVPWTEIPFLPIATSPNIKVPRQ